MADILDFLQRMSKYALAAAAAVPVGAPTAGVLPPSL
jgi:hypothetical protein